MAVPFTTAVKGTSLVRMRQWQMFSKLKSVGKNIALRYQVTLEIIYLNLSS